MIDNSNNKTLSSIKEYIRNGRSSKSIILRSSIKFIDFIRSVFYSMKSIFIDKEYRAIFYIKLFKSSSTSYATYSYE